MMPLNPVDGQPLAAKLVNSLTATDNSRRETQARPAALHFSINIKMPMMSHAMR
jgi:hypothetical protein